MVVSRQAILQDVKGTVMPVWVWHKVVQLVHRWWFKQFSLASSIFSKYYLCTLYLKKVKKLAGQYGTHTVKMSLHVAEDFWPAPNRYSWALSPLSTHSDIGQKGSQSDIISLIGLTFLAISDIWLRMVLVVVKVPVYSSDYPISD
jgi:hypothetical protein